MLTHALEDPYNFDHPNAAHFAQETRVVAQAMGHKPGAKYTYAAPPVFLFEPHQPEQCNFKPEVILNIDEVWETKYKAFQVLAAQKHLWDYYERVALNRGVQGGRNTGKPMTYGEAYQRLFPAGAGGTGMKPVVVRNIKRADANACGVLGGLGVSTAHEALGRIGLMKPYMRPIWPGASIAGPAVTVLAQPGDNWMIHVAIEQCQTGRRAGGRLHRRQHRRHVRRSARHLAEGARRQGPGHRCRLPRREDAEGDGLPGLVARDLRQGHGQGDARLR